MSVMEGTVSKANSKGKHASSEYEEILSGMSSAEAFGFVRDIAEIGNRWLGTRGESKAREYILRRFREFGIEEVHTEEFEYLNYLPRRSKLEITHPVRQTLDCQPLEYSKNGKVEAELVYVGEGTEAEFKQLDMLGVDLKGKIVAATSFAPFLITPYCERRRAAGMIVISDAPKSYIRRLTARLDTSADN